MDALTTMHGWGWALVILGIFGWSALMLLIVLAFANIGLGRAAPRRRRARATREHAQR